MSLASSPMYSPGSAVLYIARHAMRPMLSAAAHYARNDSVDFARSPASVIDGEAVDLYFWSS
jgi:hypothetical protein